MIHLNCAGASIVSKKVHSSIVDFLEKERQIGPYEAAGDAKSQLESVRDKVARLTSTEPNSIALCDSATRAWNTLVYSIPFSEGDVVYTSQLEFGSVLASLVHLKTIKGIQVKVLPATELGSIHVADAEKILREERVALVAICQAPAHVPVVNDVEAIDSITKSLGIPLFVDGCQSYGVIQSAPIKNPRHAVCGTSRKWLGGPRGVGFLSVSSDWRRSLEPPTADLANTDVENLGEKQLSELDWVSSGKKFETWEKSMASLAGFGAALDEVNKAGMEANFDRARQLLACLSERALARLIISDRLDTPLVSLRLTRTESKRVKNAFSAAEINASFMERWDAPIDFERRKLEITLRMSTNANLNPAVFSEVSSVLDRSLAE